MMTQDQAVDFLSDFSARYNCDFYECVDAYKKMKDICDEHPELEFYTFDALKKSMSFSGCIHDTYHLAYDVFNRLAAQASAENAERMYKEIFDINPDFAVSQVSNLLDIKPELSTTVFESIIKKTEDIEPNSAGKFANCVCAAICHAGESEALQFLTTALDNPKIQSGVYYNMDKIYDAHPTLGRQLLELNEKYRHIYEGAFYSTAAHIAASNPFVNKDTDYVADDFVIDAEVRELAVKSVEKNIANPDNDSYTLTHAYKACGMIMQYLPQYSDRITAAVNVGLQNPNNSKNSRKTAYRAINDYEKLVSTVSFHQRVEQTDDNPYGFKNTDNIDDKKPCVLVLGGDGVVQEKALNGYLGNVVRLLAKYGLDDKVNVYGVVYDFGDYLQLNSARTKMMDDYHRNLSSRHNSFALSKRREILQSITPESKNPKYIKDIFEKTVLPRITDENGQKLDTATAAHNIRNLHIVAHCHGAFTALKLEEMMQQKMEQLGYDKDEREFIQKQMLIVAQSPYCPLGVSKSTMVSFFSAADEETNHDNHFQNAIQNMRKESFIPLSYFPGKRGNMFLVNDMGKNCDEHNYWGLSIADKTSKEAQAMILFERKALINGLKNALNGSEIPDTRDLVADDENSRYLLQIAEHNGDALYGKIYSFALATAKKYRGK